MWETSSAISIIRKFTVPYPSSGSAPFWNRSVQPRDFETMKGLPSTQSKSANRRFHHSCRCDKNIRNYFPDNFFGFAMLLPSEDFTHCSAGEICLTPKSELSTAAVVAGHVGIGKPLVLGPLRGFGANFGLRRLGARFLPENLSDLVDDGTL